MASKFQQDKETTGMTPLSDWVATSLFEITHKLAEKQEIPHAVWIRRAMTAAVHAQAPELNYVYPEKEALATKVSRLEAELAAYKAREEEAKKQATPLVPTPPAQKADPETGKVS